MTPTGNRFWSVGVNQIDVYHPDHADPENLVAHYPTTQDWLRGTSATTEGWGFTTLGAWCMTGMEAAHPEADNWRDRVYDSWTDRRYYSGVRRPYCAILYPAVASFHRHHMHDQQQFDRERLPDVWSPEWVERVKFRAAFVAGFHAQDPYLIGYFIGNENAWPDDGGRYWWARRLLGEQGETPAKRAFATLMEQRYHNIAMWDVAYGLDLDSFDAIAGASRLGQVDYVPEDMAAYYAEIAERYFSTTAAAIREVDDHHLILGDRLMGSAWESIPRDVMRAAGRHCDVISVNSYADTSELAELGVLWTEIHRLTGRPVLASEFGYLCTTGHPYPRAASQAERGRKYAKYLAHAHAHPAVVGAHVHAYYDMGGQNWGLVNPYSLEPYGDYVVAVQAANAELLRRERAKGWSIDS